MKDLILTGFMGTGKSTVGQILAAGYGIPFVDLDREIERRVGATIHSIFDQQGEAAFRKLESAVLAGLLGDGEGRIIATGGGALLSAENRALLAGDQPVVCLTCGSEELARRIESQGGRPLLPGTVPEQIRELLRERAAVYDLFPQVDTDQRAPEEVAKEIASLVTLRQAGSLCFSNHAETLLLFQAGLLDLIGSVLRDHGLDGSILLVTDRTVAGLGLCDSVLASLQVAGFTVHSIVVPSGEQHKCLASLEKLYGAALRAGLDREATILGLGGGVVCDLAGMVAATYLRGIRLVLVPTTLLAQVDASIGGKVGVDFQGVKNLVGAFYPARLVLIDPQVLRTLPKIALADGMVEIIKIALIRSVALLELVQDLDDVTDVLDHPMVIRQAAQQKIQLVEVDPYERGKRMLLNFGHTVGHALEAASGYHLSHGQAVSMGMAAEMWLGVQQGWCREDDFGVLTALQHRFDLPSTAHSCERSARVSVDPDQVLTLTRYDKKRTAGKLRLALPIGPGEGAIFEAEEPDIRRAIAVALSETA